MDDEVRDGERRDLGERAFEFARRVVALCQAIERKPGVSRTLSRQLLRAGCSVGANVEEGLGAQSRADFVTKYSIACKEAREAHYWLRLMSASGLVRSERIAELTEEANQIVAILTTILRKTKAQKT
ncbi:MAG: four helix bundle protein [Thermoanaerobaculia bacterium]